MWFELISLAFFLACWLLSLLHMLGVVSFAGPVELGLYGFYTVAVAVGWVAGNVYVHRTRGLLRPFRRRLLMVYLLGPPGALYLLRAMAPAEAQRAAPFAGFYSFGVFAILFLVPVTLKGVGVSRESD